MHTWVRLRFPCASDPDLKDIGWALDALVRQRNEASYDLQSTAFTPAKVAQKAIQESIAALTLLDQIEADPARRAAAIASIQP